MANQDDKKALFKAVDSGRVNRVEELLDRRNSADELAEVFNRTVSDLRTVKRNRGHWRILMLCIDRGLDAMTRIGELNQPLVCAASMNGNRGIIRYINEEVGLPDCPFVRASIGDFDFLKEELNADSLAGLRDENGFCLMHYAVGSGLGRLDDDAGSWQEETCKFLIERGVPTNLVAENGNNPFGENERQIRLTPTLFCAWYCGSPDIMQMLIDAGDVDAVDLAQAIEFAFEPLQRTGEPFAEVAAVVLKNGFEINSIRPDQKRTLLHGSASRGSTAAVAWLLENGADPNVLDDRAGTSLHAAAVRNSHASVAQLLIEGGANPALRDADGKTAFELAEENGRKKVADFLRIQ